MSRASIVISAIAVSLLAASFQFGEHFLLPLAASLLATAIYYACLQHWNYFSRNGVPFVRGMPLMGALWPMLCKRRSLSDTFLDLYRRFPAEPFFGMYEMLGRPVYVIRDPELAKQIFIKDFDHFVNHRATVAVETDPILGRTMFMVRDDHWRTIRSTISPAFTGRKMRLMLSLVAECARNFSGHLRRECTAEAKVYDMRDLFARFACDGIATASFGLEVNSLEDRNNRFFRMGMETSKFDGLQGLKFLGFTAIPRVMRWLRVAFFTPAQVEYFRQLVQGNMEYREKNGVVRHDMINLLMEARQGKLFHSEQDGGGEVDRNIGFATVDESEVGKSTQVMQKWEDDDLVSQSMIFILAGFNAISYSLSFMAHELAVNPDIQQRLYEEIRSYADEFADKPLSYETLQKMSYLDMVVSESLRRWALGGTQDRAVSRPYELTNRDGSKVQLNVGDGVWVVINGFHLDEQYFPDPERFDPERFSEENKHKIVPGTYLPFGAGPRNCVGSRFALMEMKALFVHLLLECELRVCSKTMNPIVLNPGAGVLMEPKDGFWLELHSRND